MIDTTFLPGITPITATWLNEANDTLVAIGTSAGASTVGCVPSGTVSATTVQGAIDQLAAQVTYTDANTRNTVLTGLVTTSAASITDTDTVLTAVGKLQRRTSDMLSAKNASGGYVGLSGWNIQLLSTTGTNVAHMQQVNTANRTYTFPDKDGTVAMTSDLNVSSAMVLLETVSVSTAVAAVNFLTSFSSTYDAYKIFITGITSSATAIVCTQLAVAGAAITTTSYTGALTGTAAAANATNVNISTTVQSGNSGANIELTIHNVNSSTLGRASIRWHSEALSTATPGFAGVSGVAMINTTGAISGFKLFMSTGNISTATIRVYGIKN